MRLPCMTEPNEQYAYFTVAGDFDPAQISLAVEVEATERWIKGELNPKTQLQRRCNRWSLYSRLARSCSLESHIGDVLDQLDANRERFSEIAFKYGACMQVVAYFKTEYPGLHLEFLTLNRLACYGLSLDCDFYFLYSDSREDS